MPVSILEAMTFGIPVITRSVGGFPDLFKSGKMGYLTESKKSEKIAEMLEKIICDKEKLINMARFNYTFAKENFMASTVSEKLTEIYSAVINTAKKK